MPESPHDRRSPSQEALLDVRVGLREAAATARLPDPPAVGAGSRGVITRLYGRLRGSAGLQLAPGISKHLRAAMTWLSVDTRGL